MINHQPKHERAMLGISIDCDHARGIQWRRAWDRLTWAALAVCHFAAIAIGMIAAIAILLLVSRG